MTNAVDKFHEFDRFGSVLGLERVRELLRRLGDPHEGMKYIHVAGTNGKGSVSHSIASLLQVFGYRVGLYTSPHLVDFSERIRVNGQPIPQDYVVEFVEKEREFFEPLNPSFFEITTALAFKFFKDMNVDIAVVEVGLGGRLDCTNIINPILSIITNISLDHMQLLGTSVEQIAMEKGGIIKPGIPVIIGETTPETRPIFEALAEEKKAPIYFAEDEDEREIISAEPVPEGGMLYKAKHLADFKGELSGLYQVKNMNTIMAAMHRLMDEDYLCQCYDPDNNRKIQEEMTLALTNVSKITGLMGRWQTVGNNPTIVCDTGHNVAGWEYLSKQLEMVKCNQMHIVFGVVEDKDVYGIMNLLPKNATYYFTKAQTKRAFPETSLKIFADQFGLKGECYATVPEAVAAAIAAAQSNDFIFIGGSTYVVADFLKSRN
jgi:dihydrofolate synthase/folylpolyglutamate synthase